MNRQERLTNILELVVEKGNIEVEEIANLLNVSTATVRRDFDVLASKQLLNRTHGGASATGGSLGIPLTYKVAKEDEAKMRIAQAAAKLVSRHQVIGLNGGTTTTAIARALADSAEFAPDANSDVVPALTVVTNAVNIAAELTVRAHIKIVVTGGVARPRSYELTGTYAEEVLKEVNIDIAFLGAEGMDIVHGASATHEDEARVNRQIAARANKIVVVSDSSKFSKTAFAVIRPANEIDILITDSGVDPIFAEQLRQLGVEIIIA